MLIAIIATIDDSDDSMTQMTRTKGAGKVINNDLRWGMPLMMLLEGVFKAIRTFRFSNLKQYICV